MLIIKTNSNQIYICQILAQVCFDFIWQISMCFQGGKVFFFKLCWEMHPRWLSGIDFHGLIA